MHFRAVVRMKECAKEGTLWSINFVKSSSTVLLHPKKEIPMTRKFVLSTILPSTLQSQVREEGGFDSYASPY